MRYILELFSNTCCHKANMPIVQIAKLMINIIISLLFRYLIGKVLNLKVKAILVWMDRWKKYINNSVILFLANHWLLFIIPLLLWIPGEWIRGIYFNEFLLKLGLYPSLMVFGINTIIGNFWNIV
jgi:hypothetical protein